MARLICPYCMVGEIEPKLGVCSNEVCGHSFSRRDIGRILQKDFVVPENELLPSAVELLNSKSSSTGSNKIDLNDTSIKDKDSKEETVKKAIEEKPLTSSDNNKPKTESFEENINHKKETQKNNSNNSDNKEVSNNRPNPSNVKKSSCESKVSDEKNSTDEKRASSEVDKKASETKSSAKSTDLSGSSTTDKSSATEKKEKETKPYSDTTKKTDAPLTAKDKIVSKTRKLKIEVSEDTTADDILNFDKSEYIQPKVNNSNEEGLEEKTQKKEEIPNPFKKSTSVNKHEGFHSVKSEEHSDSLNLAAANNDMSPAQRAQARYKKSQEVINEVDYNFNSDNYYDDVPLKSNKKPKAFSIKKYVYAILYVACYVGFTIGLIYSF